MIEAHIVGDDRLAARLQTVGDKIRAALLDSMKRQWLRVQTEVVTGKLSGDPLHRRTGVLASSINVGGAQTATAFEQSPALIVGRVGTRVRYGAIHENGGTFTITAHTRRLTQVFGRDVSPRTVDVREHRATFPQRSFLRSTLRTMADSIREQLQADVAAAAKG